MPPKPRFTREEIVSAALELVSEKGVDALTARELGARLNSSARPIFTVFRSMEELQTEVRAAAMHRFESYADKEPGTMPAFKHAGMQMVRFGVEEPKLYQLLFMRENSAAVSFDDVFGGLGSTAEKCIGAICRDYGLTRSDAEVLFENVWVYTFGVGALCATGSCHFSAEKLSRMLTTQFQAVMMWVSSHGSGDAGNV